MGNILLTQEEFTFPATVILHISGIWICPFFTTKSFLVSLFLETLVTGWVVNPFIWVTPVSSPPIWINRVSAKPSSTGQVVKCEA